MGERKRKRKREKSEREKEEKKRKREHGEGHPHGCHRVPVTKCQLGPPPSSPRVPSYSPIVTRAQPSWWAHPVGGHIVLPGEGGYNNRNNNRKVTHPLNHRGPTRTSAWRRRRQRQRQRWYMGAAERAGLAGRGCGSGSGVDVCPRRYTDVRVCARRGPSSAQLVLKARHESVTLHAARNRASQ